MPDKLLWAVEWMEQQDLKKPCLFHSAFENVDGSLAYLSTYYPPQYQYTFQRALTECRYFGFSMVINGPLRELMLKGNPSNIVSHDWWAQLIAVAFGTCEFDSRVATKHRRHIESVTLDNKNRKIKWLKQSLKEGNKIANNADEFERIFGECISENEKYLLKLFTHKSIKGNFIRAFYFKRWRPTWISEITLRSLMLFGRS